MIIGNKEAFRSETLHEDVNRVLLSAAMLQSLRSLVEATMRLYKRKSEPTYFSLIAVYAATEDLEALLAKEKRTSDILVAIDGMRNHYALLCLDTKVQGGFHFAQRLMHRLKTTFAEEAYIVAADVRNMENDTGDIVTALADTLWEARTTRKNGEVILRSLR